MSVLLKTENPSFTSSKIIINYRFGNIFRFQSEIGPPASRGGLLSVHLKGHLSVHHRNRSDLFAV